MSQLGFGNKIWNRILVWLFHLLYHQFAFTYDWVAALVSGGKWKDFVLESARLISQDPILELGFGPGYLQGLFLRKGKRIFGLDESRFMNQRARKFLQKSGFTIQQLGLCRGVAQNLPFKGESFSTVVATFPTPYALDQRTIAECWRVLQKGGKVVILLGIRHGSSSLYGRFMRWLFGITRQSFNTSILNSTWAERYLQQGFQVEQVWRDFQGDQLWFLLAEKGATPFANG